ncbi:hypothetical protein GCM10011588_65420 [Nocardia jinanensis]|uniref:Bacterial bifunctional deaminase-reductase C-terminal domain-containing protein n=1 Tax=Nocardia jinanensis TaxID=382504 RepID=A0A917RY63_9NOCA|nr:hypothetical protein GCM10011588_65420 [Nocardia jinanensis]
MLPGDPVVSVGELLRRPGRELQIHGSSYLGDALLAAGLVHTVRLTVAPTVLRTGRRLLAGTGPATGLQLSRHEVTDSGLLLLEYEVTGSAPLAEFDGLTQFL